MTGKSELVGINRVSVNIPTDEMQYRVAIAVGLSSVTSQRGGRYGSIVVSIRQREEESFWFQGLVAWIHGEGSHMTWEEWWASYIAYLCEK